MQQQDGPGRIPEPVASDPDNFYVDSLGQVIMRDSADPYDDGPGIHVAADGKTVEGAQRREVLGKLVAGIAMLGRSFRGLRHFPVPFCRS